MFDTTEKPRKLLNIQIERTWIGYYAVDADIYDGAPDAGYPSNCIGHGMTPDEAIADLLENLGDE